MNQRDKWRRGGQDRVGWWAWRRGHGTPGRRHSEVWGSRRARLLARGERRGGVRRSSRGRFGSVDEGGRGTWRRYGGGRSCRLVDRVRSSVRPLCRLRGANALTRHPLSQDHKGVTDLGVGPSNRDVALIARAAFDSISSNPSARDVVDLFQSVTASADDVCSDRIRDRHSDQVTVGFSLLRERLSKVEGDGLRRCSSDLLRRTPLRSLSGWRLRLRGGGSRRRRLLLALGRGMGTGGRDGRFGRRG